MTFFRPQIPPLPREPEKEQEPAAPSAAPQCRFEKQADVEPLFAEIRGELKLLSAKLEALMGFFHPQVPPVPKEDRPEQVKCGFQQADNSALEKQLRLQSALLAAFTVVNLIVLAVLTFR